jgi:hypothetical protein
MVERVVELVALEHVVVLSRLVCRSMLRVDGTPDSPDGPFSALDPHDDAFFGAPVVDTGDRALGEPTGRRSSPHWVYDRGVGRLSQFFRNPFSFLFERSSHEDRLAAYVIREHDRGRPIEEILNDRYILNRTTPSQLQRLLDNPDLVRALGNDTIESVRATMESTASR